jgi:hypothetical protein
MAHWDEAAAAMVLVALAVLQSARADMRQGGTEVGARVCYLRGQMVERGKFWPGGGWYFFNGGAACGAVGAGRVKARPVGDGWPTMALPRCSWVTCVRSAPNRGEARADRWAPHYSPGWRGDKMV